MMTTVPIRSEQLLLTTYRCGIGTFDIGCVVTRRYDRRSAADHDATLVCERKRYADDGHAVWEPLGSWGRVEDIPAALDYHALVAAWSRVGLPGTPVPACRKTATVVGAENCDARYDVVTCSRALDGWQSGMATTARGLEVVLASITPAMVHVIGRSRVTDVNVCVGERMFLVDATVAWWETRGASEPGFPFGDGIDVTFDSLYEAPATPDGPTEYGRAVPVPAEARDAILDAHRAAFEEAAIAAVEESAAERSTR